MVLNRELNIAEGEVLLVCKPKGWTSFDVVNRIRILFHVAKVGHAGTLDPMATGLLIVCTGKKTKEIEQYVGLEKEYEAQMILGARTPSFDAETTIIERRTTEDITEQMVRKTLEEFAGYQTQLPPMWSAAKVGGKRLYKYARKGQEVERRPREVFVKSIVPSAISIPEVRFTIVCSKGTYVRTLVDDIGKRLGCGAYLNALERTRLGEFLLADAVTIEELLQHRIKKSDQSV
jgi:tRNA pseudouridine55 synthase